MNGIIKPATQNISRAAKIAILPLLLCLSSISPSTALAQEARPARTMVVTGQGDRSVQTTKARVQLGIEIEAKTAQEVQLEIASKTNALVAKLQELNVEKLQTTNITLNPKYVYENNRPPRQVGFTGQTSVSFVTSLDKAGKTLDAAVASGANRVDQISFIAPEDVLNSARNAALQDAVKDAQSQADAVLSVLNLKVQSVRTIQVNNAPPVQPLNNQATFAKADAAQSTPVIGGEQRVQTSVVMEFNY
jgi:uncharacterized protein